MRSVILPVAAWAGVLQTITPRPATLDQAAQLVGLATVLGSFTVLVYRLGVWRQEMENTRKNLDANFIHIERRLDRLERLDDSSELEADEEDE